MQPRIPFLISFLAIAAMIVVLVAINVYAGSAHAQGPISTYTSSVQSPANNLTLNAVAPATMLTTTSGERSNALVTRAAAGVLMLMVCIAGRLVLIRRRALL